MSEKNIEDVLNYLGVLETLLDRGDIAYKNYLSNGKKFLYAKILKDNNEEIRELIINKNHLLPLEQKPKAMVLLAHIDIWSVLWEELDSRKRHKINEEFFFENHDNFPKESLASLYDYYVEISLNETESLSDVTIPT